jgi:hypothetical protein
MMLINGGASHLSSHGAHEMRTQHHRVPRQQQFPPWSCGCVRSLDPSLPDVSHAGHHN